MPRPPLLAPLAVALLACGCSSNEDAAEPIDVPAVAAEPAPPPTVPLRLMSGDPPAGTVRPAVRIHLEDQTESWFGNAELYLTVQSSRFDANTLLVLPINVGEFRGVEDRFVDLPFAVAPGDTLVFNLLDDDKLGSEGEAALIGAGRVAGYAVVLAGSLYEPTAVRFAAAGGAAGALTGKAVGLSWRRDAFDNYGTAEYRVPPALPATEGAANEIAIKSRGTFPSVGGGTAPTTPAFVKIFAKP